MLSTIRRPRITVAAALFGVVLVAAGCSSAGGGASSAAGSAAAPASAAAASAGGAAQGGADVGVGNGAVGAFLTGKDGKTLYVFTPDFATKDKSTCTAACATSWPPFTVAAGATPKADSGVTGTLTTFARDDGTMQVAINGLPLYYFAKDTKAGDTNGQGVGGKWFVASPSGAVPSAPASGAAPAASGAAPSATKAGY